MCGILGITSRASNIAIFPSHNLERLWHRGPDARGQCVLQGPAKEACVLAHTRLRIIDLSSEADQPFPNEDETVWVSYNGELYNYRELRVDLEQAGHRFSSHSDTEVLVHLYEDVGGDVEQMLGRLRGMFAFALFDTKRGRLVLARDRLGIKPLYWTRNGDGVAFASEVRALADVAGLSGPDLKGVSGYLAWGVVPGPRTIIEGVQEIPAGCYLLWAEGRSDVRRWWSPSPAADRVLVDEAVPLMRTALDDAVARHLVAERPVGLFLSGGLDSAVIATLAAGHGQARALTVTFPDAQDEGVEATTAARRAGVEQQQVPVTGEDVARRVDDVLSAMDQPTCDGVNSWVVCHAAQEADLVVALSGLGGDELFGGYPSFRQVPALARLRPLLSSLPGPVRSASARLLGSRNPGGRISRVLDAGPGYHGCYRAVRGIFSDAEVNGHRAGVRCVPPREGGWPHDPRDRVMLLEMTHYLSSQLLRDTDQMSMAHSLEVRVPLLDDTVVRAALALPPDVRAAPRKSLLAEAAGVQEHANKQPFTLPFSQWLRGPLRDVVREGLLSERLPFGDVVPADLRRRVWSGFEGGQVHWSRPWALAVLRLWPQANGFAW